MNLASFLFLVWWHCLVVGELSGKTTNINSCVTVPISKEELSHLRNVSARLDTFLDRNLVSDHQRLNKVLRAFGLHKQSTLKVDPDDPLESFLLQYQIALHQDMNRMFFELKQLLQSAMGPSEPPRNNESDPKISSPPFFPPRPPPFTGSSQLSPFLRKTESYSPTDYTLRPTDCSDLLVSGNTESGVYDIYPFRCRCSRPVKVFCDMETDGGGWTVFLSRMNTSKPVNFTRNWADYRDGFGTPGEEHWLGNEHLFALTSSRSYILRMEASDAAEREIWGEWNTFKVESEENKYKITSTTQHPKSTASDRFTSNVNGNFFSTFDADNDKYAKGHCANSYKGGWWYNACHLINPTGIHGTHSTTGIHMNPWSKTDATIRYATRLDLKIRPHICSSTISVAQVNTHNCIFN